MPDPRHPFRLQRILRGSQHPCGKLAAADVHRIRMSVGSCRAVGRLYGISPMQVSRIRRGTRWASLRWIGRRAGPEE